MSTDDRSAHNKLREAFAKKAAPATERKRTLDTPVPRQATEAPPSPKTATRPNWAKYRNMRWVFVWQAVLLSVNLEPDEFTFDARGIFPRPERGELPDDPADETLDRASVAVMHLASGALKVQDARPSRGPLEWVVDLEVFCSWALALPVPWKLPPELAAYGAQSAQSRIASAEDPVPVQAQSNTGRVHKAAGGGRRDVLAPLIERAQADSSDPSDVAQVWARLRRMAERDDRPPPLYGLDDAGIMYDKGGKPATFTRDALSKRLGRQPK